jgi:putative Mg2+ transporter-C (MgtC) family protein
LDTLSNLEILERVLVSLIAGAVIGIEREWSNKPAGIRTYALVSEGSALFMIASLLLSHEVTSAGGTSDPSRIASTVVQGVGFIAGGVIFTHRARVTGLTTAAGLWVASAVGLASGAGFYIVALIGVLTSLFALVPMRWFEQEVVRGSAGEEHTENPKSGGVSDEANLL